MYINFNDLYNVCLNYFMYRLSSHGIRPFSQNIAMLTLLENHMTKFSIPQYTLADVSKVLLDYFHTCTHCMY